MSTVHVKSHDQEFDVEGKGYSIDLSHSYRGTPAYADTEGWQPNAEQLWGNYWRPVLVHCAWPTLPNEYVVSMEPGGRARTTTRPLRPLTT